MAGMEAAAGARNFVVERLIGATGEPDQIVKATRALAARIVPAVREALAEQVSFPVGIEVEAVELSRMSDAKRPDAVGEALVVAASATSPDAMILRADMRAAALLVTALFGAAPDAAPTPIERPLSGIELRVVSFAFDAFARAINGSGPRALNVKFPIPRAVSGSDLEKLVLRDGPGVRIVFLLETPSGTGHVEVTIPQRVMLAHRVEAAEPEEEVQPEAWSRRFSSEVMRSVVRLEATVPLEPMTLGELSMLSEGQIIEFPEEPGVEARLSARGMTLFTCEFGKLGQNYTVRLVEPFDADREFIDGLLP